MLMVLEPERGCFSIETIKRWASDILFVEEGIASNPEQMSIEEAIHIVHQYGFAKIRR